MLSCTDTNKIPLPLVLCKTQFNHRKCWGGGGDRIASSVMWRTKAADVLGILWGESWRKDLVRGKMNEKLTTNRTVCCQQTLHLKSCRRPVRESTAPSELLMSRCWWGKVKPMWASATTVASAGEGNLLAVPSVQSRRRQESEREVQQFGNSSFQLSS